VENVARAKPFAVLPGSGMSIEITLKTGAKVSVALLGWRILGSGTSIEWASSMIGIFLLLEL
jgi:hypothetical protein